MCNPSSALKVRMLRLLLVLLILFPYESITDYVPREHAYGCTTRGVSGVLQWPVEDDSRHGLAYQTICLGVSGNITAFHQLDPCEYLCRFRI